MGAGEAGPAEGTVATASPGGRRRALEELGCARSLCPRARVSGHAGEVAAGLGLAGALRARSASGRFQGAASASWVSGRGPGTRAPRLRLAPGQALLAPRRRPS